MEFKKILTLFAVFLAVSGVALALPGANIESSTPQERWSGDPAADQNDTTEGGNVTFLELNGTSLTDRWAGYYGNISSVVLYLTDETGGSSNHLYQWTGAGGPADWTSGIVCAAQDSAFDWSNAAAATGIEVNTAWSFGSVADNATQTFTLTGCDIDFTATGDQDVTGAAMIDNSGPAGSSTFSTCGIHDDNSATEPDFAFCTPNVTDTGSGVNYKGDAVNFELIVPITATETDTYFFFLEVEY